MGETMPLSEALGRLTDMHEAERDRLETWTEEVAPKLAATLGVPVDQLRAMLNAHLARHLATLGEITRQEAADLAAASRFYSNHPNGRN